MSNFFSIFSNLFKPTQSKFPSDSATEPAQITQSKVLVIVYRPGDGQSHRDNAVTAAKMVSSSRLDHRVHERTCLKLAEAWHAIKSSSVWM